ncbi:hypothetical protein JAAARDRAFT_33978 [Jaapia argillacea MUCL 33604]|uniref:Protein kinase domain-containing protein n=1 Tax=Jaapia argillacea MUCL 33604 TaxID=933084 RepID=A0A067PZE3_9AGAM|nr:hypothetical protein JAAARDRAFT_33978 [Jaapia argillacea MUCL 33604]
MHPVQTLIHHPLGWGLRIGLREIPGGTARIRPKPPMRKDTRSAQLPSSTASVPSRAESAPSRTGSDSTGSPTSVMDLTVQITTINEYAYSSGGYSDIFEAEWVDKHGLKTKRLRVFADMEYDFERARKRLNREVFVWGRLDHPNIVKLFGITYHMNERPAMVMQWYSNGSAVEYLQSHPNESRRRLIWNMIEGLSYLHESNPPIVHGDLKGHNILISDDGHAVLSDFGLSRVVQDLGGSPSGNTTGSLAGSVRWAAPELLESGEDEDSLPRHTLATDIWAFACTAFELSSGKLPYWRRVNDCRVIHDIIEGTKPGKADDGSIPHVGKDIWQLLEFCWVWDPPKRPSIRDVVSELQCCSR